MDIKQACYILSIVHTRDEPEESPIDFSIYVGASPENPASPEAYSLAPDDYQDAWRAVREEFKIPEQTEEQRIQSLYDALTQYLAHWCHRAARAGNMEEAKRIVSSTEALDEVLQERGINTDMDRFNRPAA